MLPPEQIFSACASIVAYVVTVKTIIHAAVPAPVQHFLFSLLRSRFCRMESMVLTVKVEDKTKMGLRNSLYDDVSEYIGSKVHCDGKKMKATRESAAKYLTFALGDDEVIYDVYEGIRIEYRYSKVEKSDASKILGQEYMELRFEEKHRGVILDRYFPYIVNLASELRSKNKITMVHSNSSTNRWDKVKLIHPSTFDTMAMNNDLKRSVIEDLDLFISRKEFYKRVGKAWKRGYLLYGPPGTGKTSLVAAIANYLNFDIFDLQLNSVQDDSSLKKLLLQISNGSVLLVEDIDRSLKLQADKGLTMAGLLNCIDGIWSSCGDERIIVFTTNDKDCLDPALIRPGRMDVHIYMGFCSFQGFKTLSQNYLGLDQHHLFPQIEQLIEGNVITPAQVAEEFMKTADAQLAMETLVQLLEKLRA